MQEVWGISGNSRSEVRGLLVVKFEDEAFKKSYINELNGTFRKTKSSSGKMAGR